MKKIKKFLTAVCTASLLFGLSVSAVSAEKYTYTVTIDPGRQGKITGTAGVQVTGADYHIGVDAGRIVITGLHAGDKVVFNHNAGAVQLNDGSKYYIKGVQQSGRENIPGYHVNGDMDWVVNYGVKGNMVGYTVNYQDAGGRTLARSNKFYGSVGDKPVAAYEYIENYIPRALGLTRTLSANEADNVFTFVYDPVETETVVRPGGTITETVTENVTVPGTTTGTTTGGGTTTGTTGGGTTTGTTTGGGTTGTQTGGTTAGEETGEAETPAETTAGGGTTEETTGGETTTGTTAGGTTGGGTTGTQTGGTAAGTETTGADVPSPAAEAPAAETPATTEIQEEQVPQANPDVVDLDEEETPKANLELDKEEVEKGFPLAVGIGIAVAAAAGIGGLIWFLKKGKKA